MGRIPARAGGSGARKSTWFGASFGLALALVLPGVATAAQKYPVPYNFAANITAEAQHSGTPPPGSNTWSCRPTAAHPRAVVLVQGCSPT